MSMSLDDNGLGPNMLDLMSSTVNKQLSDIGGKVGLSPDEITGLGNAFLPQALKSSWSRDAPRPQAMPAISSLALEGESGAGSFTAPICDLFIEVFGLKENNWLRRQAIVVILQQFLGSTIER